MTGRVDELEEAVEQLEAAADALRTEYAETRGRLRELESALDLAVDRTADVDDGVDGAPTGASQAAVDRALEDVDPASEDILEA